jgi:hypothetical protein
MKYSNGVDTTMRHTLYLKLVRLLGIYRSSGRAPIVKSMHDFWKKRNKLASNVISQVSMCSNYRKNKSGSKYLID